MSTIARRAQRLSWNAERFGVALGGLANRISNGDTPSVLCNSVPKAGTHLLERALCLHPRLYRKLLPTINDRNIGRWKDLDAILGRLRPGQVLITHLACQPARVAALETHETRSILLVRDPRDIVVSQAFYIPRNRKHPFHETLTSVDDLGARMRLVIRGAPEVGMPSLAARLASFEGWLHEACLVVRFEDLVGAAGGGDTETQLAVLSEVFGHVGLEMTADEVAGLASRIFSDASPTFRKGAAGQWREQFDDETSLLFSELLGDALCTFGYADP